MAAQLLFFAGEDFHINSAAGSGLGFFGSNFGNSIAVGSYQDTTFITNSAGTAQNAQVDNVKFTANQSGSVNGAGPINLLSIANYQATLNIRFTNDTDVTVQNAKFRIYDRNNINNDPTGVTVKVAEIIHPWITASPQGSGDTVWINARGSSVVVDLVTNPHISGLFLGGPSTRHDFYVAISPSPDVVGSRLFAGYVSLEYL